MQRSTRQLAIMFADISGSTRLYELLGDANARDTVAACLVRMGQIVEQCGGTVIKTIGDELMCSFADTGDAGTAACQLNEVLQEDSTINGERGSMRLRLRTGVHFGQVIIDQGDLFGDSVNVAARMTALAKPDQIILSQDAVERLPPILKANTRLIDRAPLKGKQEAMNIHELIWQQEDVTRMSPATAGQSAPLAELRLRYRDTELVVNERRGQVVLGRSKTADMVVDETLASRQHVRIEYRRGKFFIIDQSTNGTYIEQQGASSFLRREELPLSGSGRISLGRSFKDKPHDVVTFSASA